MNLFDIRTIVFSYLIISIICVWFVAQLWRQNRNRFTGIVFWLIDFVFQTVALFMIVMRGTIPDWASMVFSNTLVISGAILGFVGQERFLGKKGPQIQNFLLVILFIIVHSHFSVVQPNLAVRNLNIAVALLLVCAQSVWLMWRRVDPGMRSLTFGVGAVNFLYCLLSSVRIAHFSIAPNVDNNYFNSTIFEALVLVSYQVLFILLTYSFVLMVNKRLISEIEAQDEKLRRNEERLSDIIFSIADWVWELDENGVYTYSSEKGYKFFGKTRGEIIGKTPFDFMPSEEAKRVASIFSEITANKLPIKDLENWNIDKNGEKMCLVTNGVPILDEAGNFKGYRGVDKNITDIKKAQAKLRENEEWLNAIFETSQAGIILISPSGVIEFANRRMAEMFGMTLRELIGTPYPDHLHESERWAGNERMQKLITGEIQSVWLDRHYIKKDGSDFWGHLSGSRLNHLDGTLRALVGVIIDISERKHAEEALQRNEATLSISQEIAHLGSWEYDTKTGKAIWSDEAYRIFGFAPNEVEVTSDLFLSMIHPEDRGRVVKGLSDIRNGYDQYDVEYRIIRRDGTERNLHSRRYVPTAIGGPGKIVGMVHDITDHKREEEGLRFHSEIMIHMAEAVYLVRMKDGIIVYSNEIFEKMFGYKPGEMIGMHLSMLNPPAEKDSEETVKKIMEEIEDKGSWQGEINNIKKDGTLFWCYAKVSVFNHSKYGRILIALHTDITSHKLAEEQKSKLETQNRQLQKSESLSRMAGAIAHHFNNQLGVVIGNLEMAIDDLPQDVEPVKRMSVAMQAAGKAANISSLMLTYLGQISGKREPLNLSDICLHDLPSLHAVIPKNITLEADFSSPGPTIIADVNQIQKVLANLINNAWEAIGSDGGSIRMNVKMVSPEEILQAAHRYPVEWQPQSMGYACLEVMDNGVGIADKDIEALFDPFFSSKFVGRGMGLAVVMGIVKAHNGVVTVESKPGRGSTFRIFFPVSEDEVLCQPSQVSQLPTTAASGTILLAEDEEMVRAMAAAMLNRIGFSVIEAADGVEAIELFRQRQGEICLVISDLTMPRMDGWATLTALRKLAPNLPMILASGYDKARVMNGEHKEWPEVFLGKPYRAKELKDAISQALAYRN